MTGPDQPDSFEKGLRFGCGFLAGIVIAACVALRNIHTFTGITWACIITAAVILGWLAKRYGDEFWYALIRHLKGPF